MFLSIFTKPHTNMHYNNTCFTPHIYHIRKNKNKTLFEMKRNKHRYQCVYINGNTICAAYIFACKCCVLDIIESFISDFPLTIISVFI